MSVGADSAGDESFHSADGVESDESAHEAPGFFGILSGLGEAPAVEGCVKVEAGEHGPVLGGLEPSECVGFPGTAFSGSGKWDFSIQTGEIQKDTVSIDESAPDFDMGALRFCGCR